MRGPTGPKALTRRGTGRIGIGTILPRGLLEWWCRMARPNRAGINSAAAFTLGAVALVIVLSPTFEKNIHALVFAYATLAVIVKRYLGSRS
jgi:hypothetical protein